MKRAKPDPAAPAKPDKPGTQHLTRVEAEAWAAEPPPAEDPLPTNLVTTADTVVNPTAPPPPPKLTRNTGTETHLPDEPGTQHFVRVEAEVVHVEPEPVGKHLQRIERTIAEPSFKLSVTQTGNLPAPVDDCWNRIGVYGDHSCSKLAQHGHCHHCPTYARAASQFLNRPIPPDYRREWSLHFAPEKRVATPAKTSVVIFRLLGEWLALPTEIFQEVAERRPLHTIPHCRHTVLLGIVNIRGELLICAALNRLLGLETAPRALIHGQRQERLMVAEWRGQRAAFPVDEVYGVHRFHNADLRKPPSLFVQGGRHCANGIFPWRQHTVGLLDPEALMAALNRNLT